VTNARRWELEGPHIIATTPVDPSAGASPRRPMLDSRAEAGSTPGPATHVVSPDGTAHDLEVVRTVLAGERDAFRILVDRESGPVIRACYRVLGDMHEAEDVAQEAFVSAYRSLSAWRGEGPFGAWLTRIAVRLAIRQLGRRRAVTWIRPGSDAAVDALIALPASSRTEPEHAVVRAEPRLQLVRPSRPWTSRIARWSPFASSLTGRWRRSRP
jgi:DNA-directed RNA polymerase specialized sigma24 family protein